MAETLLNPFAFQALISIILLIAITKWLSKSTKNINSPPSPRRLPILGHLHRLSSLPHLDLHSMAKKHGPIMLLHLGSVPTLIPSSAAAAAEIMKTHDLAFANRPDSSISRRLLYDNKGVSFAPYGEYWRQLKSISVVQLLSSKRVQSFHSVRAEETEILIGKIGENPECVDLSRMFTQLTNDVVCRSAFGGKCGDGEQGERFLSILREFLEVLSTISIADFVPPKVTRTLGQERNHFSHGKLAWRNVVPPRAQLLLRFILQGRLNTRQRLFRFSFPRVEDELCVLCREEPETIDIVGISPFACPRTQYLVLLHGWTHRSGDLIRKFGALSST